MVSKVDKKFASQSQICDDVAENRELLLTSRSTTVVQSCSRCISKILSASARGPANTYGPVECSCGAYVMPTDCLQLVLGVLPYPKTFS